MARRRHGCGMASQRRMRHQGGLGRLGEDMDAAELKKELAIVVAGL